MREQAAAAATADMEGVAYLEADIADYWALLKPRVMSLVIFTALVGMVAAPADVNVFTALTALLCISIGAGASGALNMWWDADIDAEMARTSGRPIPQGKVAPGEAAAFGWVFSAGSVFVMAALVNYVAAALLAFTIAFYVFVYTMWLKRRTPQNIVIGGASGALPPVIGWAAVTGSVSIEPLVLFAIIFMWTPPHFWALALVKSGDYERVGVPMLPVVAGPDATRTNILIYSLLLAPLGLAPALLGFAGMVYAGTAAILGTGFVLGAVAVYRRRTGPEANRTAMQLFGFSLVYLFALFAALLAEHLLGLPQLGAVL